MILLDTNILLRYSRNTDPDFARVDASIRTLNAQGEPLCVVPQNLYEFWAVATRPVAANGLGFSVHESQVQITRIKRLSQLLPDQPSLFSEWEALVVGLACHGRVSFDARLVASMQTYGMTRLLTFNGVDFVRFPGLTILDPTTIAAPASTPPSSPP